MFISALGHMFIPVDIYVWLFPVLCNIYIYVCMYVVSSVYCMYSCTDLMAEIGPGNTQVLATWPIMVSVGCAKPLCPAFPKPHYTHPESYSEPTDVLSCVILYGSLCSDCIPNHWRFCCWGEYFSSQTTCLSSDSYWITVTTGYWIHFSAWLLLTRYAEAN
jgi:hypothetical protein